MPIGGSPALLMIQGRQVELQFPFSRGFSVIPRRIGAALIKSAGEPEIRACLERFERAIGGVVGPIVSFGSAFSSFFGRAGPVQLFLLRLNCSRTPTSDANDGPDRRVKLGTLYARDIPSSHILPVCPSWV